jgi:hypothetical protein
MTDARLVSSNVPETDHPAWAAGTAYAVGAKVIRTTTHRIYERLVAGTTPGLPEVDTINWLDTGPTNRWAMFDLERNSQTVSTGTITVVIAPGQRIDSVALMGLDADSISITMTVAGTVRYTHTETLTQRPTLTWTDYHFGAFKYKPSVVRFGLPSYTGASITVTITSARPAVKCGAIVLGRSSYIGKVLVDPESDRLSFSRIERDQFGNAKLNKRTTTPKTSQTLFMDAYLVPVVEALRKDLDSAPCVWSGMDDRNENNYFESLLILGIYRTWPIRMSGLTHAQATLTLEEI